jgi:cation diffusion facilitator CzcD-associated flavoprotein CzcO
MPTQYDAIIIGAGHNGLTYACYLAKAGLEVFVLQRYHDVGSMTLTEELTLPGFRTDPPKDLLGPQPRFPGSDRHKYVTGWAPIPTSRSRGAMFKNSPCIYPLHHRLP